MQKANPAYFLLKIKPKQLIFFQRCEMIVRKRGKIVGEPPCAVQMPATQLQSDWWKAAWRGTQTCFAARRSAVQLDPLYERQVR